MLAAEQGKGQRSGLIERKRSGKISQGQFSHGALQRVAGPVVVVPAQEPAGECGRLEALLDLNDGRPAVSVGRIRLDVTNRFGRSGKALISANYSRVKPQSFIVIHKKKVVFF